MECSDKIKVESEGRVTVLKNIEIVDYDFSDEEASDGDDDVFRKSLFQGNGTMLKYIPNVSHKLSLLKAGQLLIFHKILFGERTKVDYIKKWEIERFCGYVWNDNERSKVKERIEKCLEQNTLNLCDILDLEFTDKNSHTSENILRFLECPCVNIETVRQCFVKVDDLGIDECVEHFTLLPFSSVIVCGSRLDAECLSDYFTQKGVVASLVHERMDNNVRKTEEDLFMEHKRKILIITKRMLTGLKFPFKVQILNYGCPIYDEYLKRLHMGHKLITFVTEQSPRYTVARLEKEFCIQVRQLSAWEEHREAHVQDPADAALWGSNVWRGKGADSDDDNDIWDY